VVFEGLAMSTKAVVVVVVVELVKVKVKVDQQCGWSSRTHLSIRKICAWNVELNWTPFYGTSGIVQIMPEEFMKALRIVDFPHCMPREQFLIGFVASITLPERGNPERGSSLNRFMSEGDADGDQ
jgi:hypothetical protein